ncbi:hypothetical protein XENOCAPTIV_010004 [Xenoophorus captivus]|uniref:ATP-binding cassette, sub-family B (MDR/TAP), member 9 n=1 Tax=Xenoophorus captivus TaxID=1517983 RepID=A0ABV0R0I6_9TELE
MGTRVSVICALLYIVLDSVITTVLYIKGTQLSSFARDVLDFNILTSALDLWGIVLLRASLLLGASIGVSWNKEDGPPRVAQVTTVILLFCMVIITYALAKLLMLTELEPLSQQPWFLSLIGWTCASSLGVVLLWRQLGRVSSSVKALTIGNSRGEAFIPYYYGKAIDSIVVHQSMEYFAKPVVAVASLALVSEICSFRSMLTQVPATHHFNLFFPLSSLAMGVRGGVFTLTFARLNLRLRSHLFKTLMRQEIAFFDENHTGNAEAHRSSLSALMYPSVYFFSVITCICWPTGDILSRLSADTTQVSDLISQNVNVFLRSAIKGTGFVIFMFRMSWKLTLVTMMGFPFIGLVSKLYGVTEICFLQKLTKEVQTVLAEANKVAEETISAMRTVRSFANESGEANSYYAKLLVMFELNKKQAVAYACYMWSKLALEVAVLYYGGHLVLTGQLSSGGLISFFIYMLELGECFEVFPQLFSSGVSFTLRPREVTALVGPSGSGKSSCVSLLENFYLPQHGQVLLDGKPVNEFQHEYLHSKVALVGQEPVLFARTIKENITYGLSDISMEAVVQAASKANAHEFITSLPKGYDTSVGEKGMQLSGGQKQRVAIARALIRHPRVLILDEATSALDAESEHIVQQALNNIMQEHTVLVIAHRLSTVEKADNIIVIDRGCIAEQGSHSQLMASGGLYCKLVQRQVLGIETGEEVFNPPASIRRKSGGGHQRGRESSGSSGSEAEYNLRY